ncbi:MULTISPECIES: TfoX/Sxy family DNA transformation protein [Vibrio]|uniref:DNA transformation protein n=1 Tax=Vibrio casei TaxID=673372 RepID=A0A368LMN7_9VIBR|nr:MULTISPECIES: TfoX/Sxy family DNA transformation protein [Vibrio]RCS73117.1 DNA transformation protein [Vibrio casei]SJN40912.1 Regulator of competence-specific genes [Vibrio casei]HBV75524.1 DNA transformation protein [Vibrio sp.]
MGSNLERSFFEYVTKFGSFQKRSMFGGIGLFSEDAMYALISNGTIFIRGGGDLDQSLEAKNCKRYKHVKKQTVATVNYFDITKLYTEGDVALDGIIEASIEYSKRERAFQKSEDSRRLRDLPNMQLTLERMVKKSGVPDVTTFLQMGPEDVFKRVKETYGSDVDIRLLWKFAGAVDGCHWKLIQEPRRQKLLSNVHH